MGLKGGKILQRLQLMWLLACASLLLQYNAYTTAAPLVSNLQAANAGPATANKSTTATGSTAYKWTVFIYMVADNDLECFGLDDMMVRLIFAHCAMTSRIPTRASLLLLVKVTMNQACAPSLLQH
jgi:hypothetical protein